MFMLTKLLGYTCIVLPLQMASIVLFFLISIETGTKRTIKFFLNILHAKENNNASTMPLQANQGKQRIRFKTSHSKMRCPSKAPRSLIINSWYY